MILTRKALVALFFALAVTTSSHISFASFISSAVLQPQEKVSLVGIWNGVIDVGTTKLRLVLKLTKSSDGGYAGVVNSLDQSGDLDLPVNTIVVKESTLRFDMKEIFAVYEGTVNADGTEIVGHWTQGGAVPLVFRRESPRAKSGKPFKRGSVKLEPCNLPNLTQEARCGKYEVFEDRVSAHGRKLALNILILPANNEQHAPDPVFFLAGGPGQGAVGVVSTGGDFLPGFRRERDLVFVDQRGTGASNPLDCNFIGDRDDMRGYFNGQSGMEPVRQCRAELEKVANLALYTTDIAMADLDEIRGALGYEQINLYGGSYGTNAALVFIRKYPTRVRAAVLKGVAPTDYKLPLVFARGVQHATDRLLDDCAADVTCHKTFPNLKVEFKEILARLDKSSATFDVLNVVTNQPQQITMSRAAFADGLRIMLYVPELTSLLPLMIHHAYDGDFAPFAAYTFLLVRQIDPQIAHGMQLSVICAEHVPFITEADITREATGTYYGDSRIRSGQKTCQEWPSVKAPANFINPVKSDVPILMISGDIDPVTPSWVAAGAAKFLPNATQVVIRDGTHLTTSPCVNNLAYEFISKGTARGLDTSCAGKIKRPPFNYKLPTSFKPTGK